MKNHRQGHSKVLNTQANHAAEEAGPKKQHQAGRGWRAGTRPTRAHAPSRTACCTPRHGSLHFLTQQWHKLVLRGPGGRLP